MIESICAIAGVPRSGTSWLGMLVDSCPVVNYRFQPLFAYAFKNAVHVDSPPSAFVDLMQRMDATEDEFLVQADKRREGLYPTFAKAQPTTCLSFKTCRYQYLLPVMLRYLPNLKVIGIVRHPCGAIHSWLTHPREFPSGSDPLREWRFGGCKNQGREEEFFGFYKWREVTHLYLDLADKYPDRVRVLRYEDLVERTGEEVEKLFGFLTLPFERQTQQFIVDCHASHQDNPYAVFKDRSVALRWQRELQPEIQRAIHEELTGTRLARFLL
jgi:hypothetical protein